MEYLVSFLEGIVTFISPCLLPMLPIYLSYFAGGEGSRRRTLRNAIGFVLGFTLVFVTLGAFAGTLGMALKRHQTIVNLVTGGIVLVFGLNYLGVFKIGFLNASKKGAMNVEKLGFWSSMLFGVVFSIGWTPCVGAFLGSALMLASQQGSVLKGILMLVVYSLGLGIPFVLSAVLIDKLKGAFDFIKRHYVVINRVSGVLLVVVGLMMMTGAMGYFLSILTF
ncbi:MAG: cytochrome c biogenesis protein CcdA [Clostridia bacterium]